MSGDLLRDDEHIASPIAEGRHWKAFYTPEALGLVRLLQTRLREARKLKREALYQAELEASRAETAELEAANLRRSLDIATEAVADLEREVERLEQLYVDVTDPRPGATWEKQHLAALADAQEQRERADRAEEKQWQELELTEKQLAATRAKLARAVEALKRHGVHDEFCAYVCPIGACDCGLAAARYDLKSGEVSDERRN